MNGSERTGRNERVETGRGPPPGRPLRRDASAWDAGGSEPAPRPCPALVLGVEFMSQTQLQVEITVARPQRQAAHRVGSGAKGRVKRGSRPLHRQNVAVSKCRCLDRFLTSDASDVGGRTFARMTWERIRGHVSLPASKPLRRYNSFYSGTRIRKTYQTFRPKPPMNRHPAGRCAPHRWARPRYDLAEALPVVT